MSPAIESHPIKTSALQRMPLAAARYRYYLPLMPRFIERLEIDDVDLVLSTSSCVAKGIIPPKGAVHASYVHSPMRYMYDRFDDYFGRGRAGIATRLAARLVRRRLQEWDISSTRRVNSLVANSHFVADRIARHYGRTARVIHPPVDVDRFDLPPRPESDYYLLVAALVPYKNADVAIEAFRGMDRRLIVAGSGPLYDKLKASAPSNVEMLGWVGDDELVDLVARCRAFLQPNVEDFGIAPVEAMAAGRPVIAVGAGGVLDSIRDIDRIDAGQLGGDIGPTGVFFSEGNPESLRRAIVRFEWESTRFNPAEIHRWARRFNRPRFEAETRAWLNGLFETESTRKAA